MYVRNFFHVSPDMIGGFLLYAGRVALHRFPTRYSADEMRKLLMSHLNMLKFKEVGVLVDAILSNSNISSSKRYLDGGSKD